MRLLRLLLVALLFAMAGPAAADEFKPAYLQLTQVDAERYDVVWKVPAVDEYTTLKVQPLFPTGVTDAGPKTSSFADSTAVQRWRIKAAGGLEGKTIGFYNLSLTRIDVLVRIARSDGTVQLDRVLPLAPSVRVEASPGPLEVVRTYTLLGVEHILTGFDHLLFVLALVLIVGGVKRLLQTITAFTLAHSITLALASLGLVHVPGPPVEAIIALSIVFVASEIIQLRRGRESLTARKPWLVAFAFGLLHGLGFAGALAEIGLPQNAIPLALLFFNVGVEIGQLLFVGAVVLVMRMAVGLAKGRVDLGRASTITAYVIGGLASYWMIERVAGFWS